MKEIPLTKGYVAIVDDEDYDLVSQFHWSACVCSRTVYARRTAYENRQWAKPKTVQLHRFLMNPPDDIEVDHIDGNGLNCTRSNMRLVTRQQNVWNKRPKSNKGSAPEYRGVFAFEGRWRAVLAIRKNKIHLGLFDSADDAARAYNVKAREMFGEYAWLNPVSEAA